MEHSQAVGGRTLREESLERNEPRTITRRLVEGRPSAVHPITSPHPDHQDTQGIVLNVAYNATIPYSITP